MKESVRDGVIRLFVVVRLLFFLTPLERGVKFRSLNFSREVGENND